MSDISLYLDQDNELKFNVAIEGSRPGTPKYRLVFEGKDLSYAFSGKQSAAGEVSFVVPTMKNVLKEGDYSAQLEVMIDDRYFAPLSFSARFEESVKVTAESIARPVQKKPEVKAAIISARPPAPPVQISENKSPVQAKPERVPVLESEFVGDLDGRKITADDLRRLIRSRK